MPGAPEGRCAGLTLRWAPAVRASACEIFVLSFIFVKVDLKNTIYCKALDSSLEAEQTFIAIEGALLPYLDQPYSPTPRVE